MAVPDSTRFCRAWRLQFRRNRNRSRAKSLGYESGASTPLGRTAAAARVRDKRVQVSVSHTLFSSPWRVRLLSPGRFMPYLGKVASISHWCSESEKAGREAGGDERKEKYNEKSNNFNTKSSPLETFPWVKCSQSARPHRDLRPRVSGKIPSEFGGRLRF